MGITTIIGLAAGAFSTLGFVPQVVKAWRTKSSQDLSLGTFGVLVAGALLWLLYGTLTGDLPLMVANGVSLAVQASMLALMVHHRRGSFPKRRLLLSAKRLLTSGRYET